MNAWSIALTNLNELPKDERLTCKVCGDKFTSGSRLDSVYCGSVCREIGLKENKRRAARLAKERKLKPLEECKPAQQRNRTRKDYWKEVFENVTA